jgi:hypothetical protein
MMRDTFMTSIYEEVEKGIVHRDQLCCDGKENISLMSVSGGRRWGRELNLVTSTMELDHDKPLN